MRSLALVWLVAAAACAGPAPTARRQTDDTTRLLGDLERRPAKPAPAAPKPGHRGYEGLSREDIQGGMRRAVRAVQACYDRYRIPGMVNVQVTIGLSGVPRQVQAVGEVPSDAEARCVCEAVRALSRFPSYMGEEVTITYPYIMR
jgi:hypothetical protein